jgi:hypothetical protein
MLHDPDRHETLAPIAWDESRARAAITRIVDDAEERFSAEHYWPLHPQDFDPSDDPEAAATSLYFGASGVLWALDHLRSVGAARLQRDPFADLDTLLARHHE